MKRILSALAAVLSLTAAPLAAAETAHDRAHIALMETALRSPPGAQAMPPKTLAQRMVELNVPGVSIAFIEDGKVKWTRAYGVADATDRRPVTPQTLFQAASMSKAVAAAGALVLVDKGRIDLDEDVNRRLKAWQVPPSAFTATEKVTLRRLLSHTAGLTVSGFPGYASDKPVPTLVQLLNGQPPANTPAVVSFEPPGQGFAYSGGGFEVAELVMTEAAGKPFPELIERLVLKPAGMTRSTFVQPLPANRMKASASGHGVRGLVIPGAHNTYPEHAAASLWTTPGDYGRFMIALQNAYAGNRPALLRQVTARTMVTPVDGNYGLGVVVSGRGGRPTFEHGGSNSGFQCNFLAFLDGSRQGIVVMTNADAGGLLVRDITYTLSEAYGWPPPPGGPIRRAPYVPTPAK